MHTDGAIYLASVAGGAIFDLVNVTSENYLEEYQKGLYFFNDYIPKYGTKSITFRYYRPSGSTLDTEDISINYIRRGMKSFMELWQLTKTADKPAKPTSSTVIGAWSTDNSLIPDEEYPYLWNVEVVKYTDGTEEVLEPENIATWIQGRGIKSIKDYYQITQTGATPDKPASPTDLGNWTDDNTIKATQDNPYLWNIEIVEYDDDTFNITNPVTIGVWVKGDTGRGVTGIIELWQVTSTSDKPAKPTSSTVIGAWSTDNTLRPDEDKPYLWNVEIVQYSDDTEDIMDPENIAMYLRGRGISSVTELWQLTSTSDKPAKPASSTVIGAWSTDNSLRPDEDHPYLWNVEIVKYTDDTEAVMEPENIATWIQGRGIAAITDYYQITSSATVPAKPEDPATLGDWKADNTIKATEEKPYLWNLEIVIYDDGTYNITDPVTIGIWVKGRGVKSITDYYQLTNTATAPTKPTSPKKLGNWTNDNTLQTDQFRKYLWNLEVVIYDDDTYNITNPVTIAIWQKGDDGRGISSVTELWQLTSTTTVPDKPASSTEIGSWSTENNLRPSQNYPYLWNVEIIRYTDDTEEIMEPENIATWIQGRGVTSITDYYQITATDTPPEKPASPEKLNNWSKTVIKPTEDKPYLWNVEIVVYNDDTNNITSPVIIGMYLKGSDGRSILNFVELWQLTSTADKPAKPTSSTEIGAWSTNNSLRPDEDKPYLWNVEIVIYNDNTEEIMEPENIATWLQGRGIASITDYYQVTKTNTKPLKPSDPYHMGDWSTDDKYPSTNEPYLWNIEVIMYDDGTWTITDPANIGVSLKGDPGDKGSDAIYVEMSTEVLNFMLRQNGKSMAQYELITFNAYAGDTELNIVEVSLSSTSTAQNVTIETVGNNKLAVKSSFGGGAPKGIIKVNVYLENTTLTRIITITTSKNDNYLGSATRWVTGVEYAVGDIVLYDTNSKVYKCIAAHTSTTSILPNAKKSAYWQDITELGAYISWADSNYLTLGMTYDYCKTTDDGTTQKYDWRDFDSLTANLFVFDDIMNTIEESEDDTIPAIKLIKKLAAATVMTKNLIVQNVNLKQNGYIKTENFESQKGFMVDAEGNIQSGNYDAAAKTGYLLDKDGNFTAHSGTFGGALSAAKFNLGEDGYIQTENYEDVSSLYYVNEIHVLNFSGPDFNAFYSDETLKLKKSDAFDIKIVVSAAFSCSDDNADGEYMAIQLAKETYNTYITLYGLTKGDAGIYSVVHEAGADYATISYLRDIPSKFSGFKIDAEGNIKSANYNAGGKTGYCLDKEGNFYANNGTFGGELVGATGLFSGAIEAISGTFKNGYFSGEIDSGPLKLSNAGTSVEYTLEEDRSYNNNYYDYGVTGSYEDFDFTSLKIVKVSQTDVQTSHTLDTKTGTSTVVSKIILSSDSENKEYTKTNVYEWTLAKSTNIPSRSPVSPITVTYTKKNDDVKTIKLLDLPTEDPKENGRLWRSGSNLYISRG